MLSTDTGAWESLEKWCSGLFLLASVILLVATMHRGLAFMLDGFAFNGWIGDLASLLGRLAALLGVGGLTAQVVERNARLGKLSRVVVSVAVGFTVVLLALAMAENAGHSTALVAIFGLSTFAFSVLTYLLVGSVIIRTGAYSTLIGGSLLAATAALLTVFFGMMVLPVGLIGTVVEGILFVLYLGLGLHLRTQYASSEQPEPVTEATPK